MKDSILFIMTGGTLDSFYDGAKDTVSLNEHSILPQYIKSLNLYCNVEFEEICMKDSRELDAEDLKNILKVIEKTKCKKIIITHGTYTMPDTARYLQANLVRKDQTIIVTGAMVPHVIINSDGPFNIGYTFAEVQRLSAGIYVAMNGRIFEPEEVAKNMKEGKFFSIFSK